MEEAAAPGSESAGEASGRLSTAEADVAPLAERYPSVGATPHRWRTRRANATAALVLIAAIAVVVVIAALASL